MILDKIRLGDYIKLCNEKNINNELNIDNVRGISTQKKFIETKADMTGVSLKGYKIVRPKCFAYVPDTSRRGNKISLAYNDTNESYLVSSISLVFQVDPSKLIPEYLFMFFNRSEFDRYSRFNSWGSAREPFNWSEMCDIEMYIPNIDVQQKYVDIYMSIKKNKTCYERGLDDLKLSCDIYIEKLKKELPLEQIGKYITLRTESNTKLEFNNNDVMGVSQDKTIIPTKSDTDGNDISKFTVIYPYDFVYNPRNGIAVGLNKTNKKYIISWNNTAFYIKDEFKNNLLPEYLMMWLSREEWNRKVKFDSWGSSTEVYSFEAMGNTSIPVPNIEIQKDIIGIYNCYLKRTKISDSLDEQLSNICSILINGSIKQN